MVEQIELPHRGIKTIEKPKQTQLSPSTFGDKLRDAAQEIAAGVALFLIYGWNWAGCRFHRKARERRNSGDLLPRSRLSRPKESFSVKIQP